MKMLPLLLFLLPNPVTGQADSEERKVRDLVMNFFDALSDNDPAAMRACISNDFTLLEDGMIWTIDSVLALTRKPRPSGFKRVNHFDFFETGLSREMAFVSYQNVAQITTTTERRTVKWLESAVLVKEDHRWKLRMLHSTRLKP